MLNGPYGLDWTPGKIIEMPKSYRCITHGECYSNYCTECGHSTCHDPKTGKCRYIHYWYNSYTNQYVPYTDSADKLKQQLEASNKYQTEMQQQQIAMLGSLAAMGGQVDGIGSLGLGSLGSLGSLPGALNGQPVPPIKLYTPEPAKTEVPMTPEVGKRKFKN